MDPRKNARRGWQQREQLRKEAAAGWQQQFPNPPKEGKKMFYANDNPNRNRNILGSGCGCLLVLAAIVLSAWLIFWNPLGLQIPAFAKAAPTQAPESTQAPATAKVLDPTQPVVSTLAPTAAPTPIVACETIMVSKDNGVTWVDAGLSLETEAVYDIGNRVTFTSRSILVPNKAYNEKLSDAELKLVEQTWLKVRYNACQTQPVLFTGGVKINTLKFDKGALFLLPLGQHEISVRNGELALWFDQKHQDKDLNRIVGEIRNGNFDIKSRLGLAVSDSLVSKLPEDIAKGVQVVLLPAN